MTFLRRIHAKLDRIARRHAGSAAPFGASSASLTSGKSSLIFEVVNPQAPGGSAVVYISDDAATWGRLTITLTNESSDSTNIELAANSPLKIYFDMLSDADIGGIRVAAGCPWAGVPSGRYLEVRPKAAISLSPDASTTIELQNVLAHAATQGKFRFFYDSLGIRNAVIPGFIERPPADGSEQWGLECPLDPRDEYHGNEDTVYVTRPGKPDIANYLLVHLYGGSGGLTPAGTPEISFSFLTGDGEFAICSDENIKNVKVTIAEQYPPGRWSNPVRDDLSQDVVWKTMPTDDGTDLFPDESFLTLRFDGIVCDVPGDTTYLFVQYFGLDKYADGHKQVPIAKGPPVPYLKTFRVMANGEPVGDGATINYAPLTFEWDVFAAEGCLLQGDTDPQPLPVPNAKTESLTPRLFQKYSLQAVVGDVPQSPWSLQFSMTAPTASISIADLGTYHRVEITGTGPLLRMANDNGKYTSTNVNIQGIWVEELINTDLSASFSAEYFFESGTPSHGRGMVSPRVKLSWTCANADHCMLYLNDTPVGGPRALIDSYETPNSDDAHLYGDGDMVYRVACIGAGAPVTQSFTRRCYAHQADAIPLGNQPGFNVAAYGVSLEIIVALI